MSGEGMEPGILTDLSAPALAFATKANLYAFFRSMGKAHAPGSPEVDGLARWHTPVQHPWFNGVLSLRPPRGDETPAIQDALRFFRSEQVASFTWWLHPGLATEAWAAQLLPHDFQIDDDTPGMAMPLEGLRPGAAPEDVQVRVVTDLETLRVWMDTFAVGYGLPPDMAGSFYDLLAGLGLDLPLRHYLGMWRGRPAAVSTLFLAAGVAGIYNVATLPEARGRGFGAHLTRLPLLEAQRMGYRAGILQSSEMGLGVYEKLGFAPVCQMAHFYWNAPEAPA